MGLELARAHQLGLQAHSSPRGAHVETAHPKTFSTVAARFTANWGFWDSSGTHVHGSGRGLPHCTAETPALPCTEFLVFNLQGGRQLLSQGIGRG